MRVYRYDNPLVGNNLMQDMSNMFDGGFSFATRLPGLHYNFQGTMTGDLQSLFDIYQSCLGHRICIFDNIGNFVWDGLVWDVELSFGGISLGPRSLSNVSNYVAVEYADILDNNNYALTSYSSDADSQAKYGIIETVLPYGGMTSPAADRARNKYIANHKEPPLGGRFAFPVGQAEASLSITALGFWATTNYRKFQSIVTTTDTVQNIINNFVSRTTVPAAPGTSYYLQHFSTDTSLVEGTDLVIARFNDHVDTIGAYLAHIVSLGSDASAAYYIGAELGSFNGNFPIGSPRIKVFPRPSAPEFVLNMARGLVYRNGSIMSPFNIRAGNMIEIQDLAPSNPVLTTLDNIRSFVVAETTYNSDTDSLAIVPEGADEEITMILARMRG